MNYKKIYAALIDRARGRSLIGYSERHHVLPRCMGGSDADANIVRLTPEEHFVAHQLLVKMHPEVPRLVYALLAMTMNATGDRMGNRLFGWMRRRLAHEMSVDRKGVARDRDMMEKIWAGNRGRKMPSHQVAKMRGALKGRKKSAEHLAAISLANKGRRSPMEGKRHSAETKAKMAAAALARKHTPETIEKLKAFAAAQTQEDRSARAFKAWETKRAQKEIEA